MDLDYDSNTDSSGESLNFRCRKSTMAETYKYYNKLLKKSGNELIYSCLPQPFFEENLRLMLIDSLKLENEVVKILLSQNDYQINKVLAFKWFFENLSFEFSTKELFPFISYSVRCKVITKLSKVLKNSDEAEKYFEFIKNTYGNDRALCLLSRCSSEFISSYFEKTKYAFAHNNEFRILYNICRWYPELGVQILSTIFEMKKRDKDSLSDYKKILLYLTGNHADLMVPFIKKYHLNMPSNTFGIRLTKKLHTKLKEDLFPDVMKSFIFREKVLFSVLNSEERIKYLTGVVNVKSKTLSYNNWEVLTHRICECLKLIPENKRLEMIESVFKQAFGSDFSNHSKSWTSEILELLPIKTRELFLQKLEVFLKKGDKTELEENVDEISFSPERPEKLIYLYDSKTAFGKLKEILQKCPDCNRRENIISLMVKNCSINNDLEVLQQVVEYFVTRHRSDYGSVISSFTEAMSNYFSPSKLNSVIFEKLEELTYISSLKHYSNHIYIRWKELHIYHRLENHMEVDIKNFFHSSVLESNHGQSFVQNFNSKQSKTFILAVCKEIIQWIRDKSLEEVPDDSFVQTSKNLLMSLIHTCKDFNYSDKSRKIFIRDIQGLEEILRKKAEEKLADVGGPEWPVDVWENIFTPRCYGDIFDSQYTDKPICISYIVKQHPEFITMYLDGILNTLLSSRLNSKKTFLNFFIVTLSFMGLLEEFKTKVLNVFENEKETPKGKAALILYSHMCTIEEFSSAVKSYVPKREKIKKKKSGFNEIQMFIPGLMQNIRPRWKNLEFILKFCIGDFLHNALPSFSICCFHARCDFVIPFLKKQLNTGCPKISFKKTVLRLIFKLSDQKEKSAFYLKCWEENKHYSVRSVLLLCISKLFLSQPSRESFQVLEKCILDSDEIDIQSLELWFKIPKKFFSDFISTLWRHSENKEKNYKENFRNQIFRFFNEESINWLPTEFCESIIRDTLFNIFSDNGIETLTALYLASKAEAVGSRVHFVLDLIKARKPSPKVLCNFINILIFASNNRTADFVDIFRILHENYPEYPLGVLFEERILLTYYYLYYSVLKRTSDSDEIAVEFGKELKTYFSKIENLNFLVFIYAKVLKDFFKVFSTLQMILTVKEFSREIPNRILGILGILSLPHEAVIWHNMKGEIFNRDIIQGKILLKEMFDVFEGDKVVEIYMRSKFNAANW